MGGPLRTQALGDLQPIHGMHPVKTLGNGTGLVALQGADEMPYQRHSGGGIALFQGFLQVILAEFALPALRSLLHLRRGKGLGYRHQSH